MPVKRSRENIETHMEEILTKVDSFVVDPRAFRLAVIITFRLLNSITLLARSHIDNHVVNAKWISSVLLKLNRTLTLL